MVTPSRRTREGTPSGTFTAYITGNDVGDYLNGLAWHRNKWRIMPARLDNSHNWMTSVLNAVGDCYNFPADGKTTPDRLYEIGHKDQWHAFYILLYDYLHDADADFYEALARQQIGAAPCLGTYCYDGQHFSGNGWGAQQRFTHPLELQYSGNSGDQGNFSGTDYMLLYNLYRLVKDQAGPPYVNHCDRVLDGALPIWQEPVPEPPGYFEYATANTPATLLGFNSIVSTQQIRTVTQPVEKPLPGDVTYRAGRSITLLPGFTVEEGATFSTILGRFDCANKKYY